MQGDKVVIKSQGHVYSGTIISFNDWGTLEHPNRYIEFNHDNDSDGHGYAYLKEDLDKPDSVDIKCGKHDRSKELDFEHYYCPLCDEEYKEEELKRWMKI